ncbi:unnamed protein product [Closterium sp. NIES-53]
MTGTDSRGANGEMAGATEAGEQGGVSGGGVGTHQPANPTLPTSSTPSPTTVDPVKAFSVEKFMGEDYEHWSFRMRLMYTQYKLLDLVEGKEKMPEAAELKGAWMKRSFDAYMLMVQAVGGRQLDHFKDLLGDPECGPKAWRKLLDVHSPTHATGIVLLARRLRDIKFVDGEPMQPVLDEMRDIFTKLKGGGVVYPELVQCMEIVIRLPESWSALAINLNSQQPQWSVDYIRARILEEDLRRRSVERSEEGAGYGVGGGKSGFKKNWKGKNKDYPKEDGGGGQGEVCFYCKKRGHRWRKCYQRPKDWTPPSSSNLHGGKRSGGVMGATGEEKDEEKGGKSEERKAGFFFVNEGTTDLAMAAKVLLHPLTHWVIDSGSSWHMTLPPTGHVLSSEETRPLLGEFSSACLGAFCRAQGIRQTFTLPASPQQNGIAQRRIGMVMDVARTSMIHAAAPHFLWPFVVQYAAHQLNLQPWVSLPETSPTLRWTGQVGDASAFRVWGSRAFVRDLSADKLSPRAVPCVFLGFPPDAPGWQFYHPTSRRVLSSQNVTFDESVPYYRLFPYRTAPLPPPPLFLAPDAVELVEVAVDSGAARGAAPPGAGSGGAELEGAEPGGAESGGAESGGAEPGGAESGGAGSGGAEPGGAEPGGAGSARVASRATSSWRELLSPQELREWFARCWSCAAGAGGTTVAAGSGGARTGGTGAAGVGGAAEATGIGPAGGTAGAAGGAGVAGPAGTGAGGAPGAGAAGGVGAHGSAGAGPSEGAGVGAVGARGAAGAGAAAGGTGAVPAGSGDATRPRPYFVPLLEQFLGLPPSTGSTSPLACPQPLPSQSQLQPASPLPAPSPYAGPTGGLTEHHEPTSRPASPVRAARTCRCAPRLRPLAVPGTHQMALRPSTAPLRVPLPFPPVSSLPALADPKSNSFRAASRTVSRLLATVVTNPSFESTVASALVAELVDFAARCRLDYATSLIAESASVCPPSVGGECALSTDVLEDRQEEF